MPKLQLILEYKHFFGVDAPENRLRLIQEIPKINLIYEIAGLNYRLKPYNQLRYNISLEKQREELRYFCPIDDTLYRRYAKIASSYSTSQEDYPLIFNRPANLFALEEIVNADDFIEEEEYEMNKAEVWDAIFKYLLAVNSEVVKFRKSNTNNLTIENFNAAAIVLNELMIEDNPLLMPYRGLRLIIFLSKSKIYGDELNRYFIEVLEIEKDRFIFNILSLLMSNKQEKQFTEFVYNTSGKDGFLEYLSRNKITNKNTITLLSIKKTPFFKHNDLRYIILDLNFLANKAFNFFINDFWFDYLKPQRNIDGKEKFNYKDYRGVFGLFFEDYVKEIIEKCFYFLTNPRPLLFDDLIISSPNGKIEIADIYIREDNKILIGQVKSGSIYESEKYSGEINILYRNNREKFFSDFGVNQTINSIKNIIKNKIIFDPELNQYENLEFYPVIIVNEKVFQTPLMPNIFNLRFKELLIHENFGNHIIHSLIIIHISDLEYLENSLSSKNLRIWDLLYTHTNILPTIMLPFYYTVDKYINPEAIPERVMNAITEIIEKYSENDTNKKN